MTTAVTDPRDALNETIELFGLKASELAKASGLDEQTISRYRHKRKKGRSVEKLFSPIHRTRAPSGGIARYLLAAVDGCKNILWRLRHGHGAAWEIPADVSPAYRNQIDSEARREFKNAKTGQTEEKWVKVRRANHLWDCEVYQVAAALVFDLFDVEAG